MSGSPGAAPGEPEIYRPGGFVNYFRPIPADDIQGAVGAKWAKRLGVKKVFILNDQELYGKGIADVFEATAKKIGLDVVANEATMTVPKTTARFSQGTANRTSAPGCEPASAITL